MATNNFMTKTEQRGSIMIYTLLILISMITMSGALLKLFLPKLHIVKEAVYSTNALYAADSAMEWCLLSNLDDPLTLPNVPAQPTISISGVSYQIYRGNNVSVCPTGETPIDYRAVGSYRGISRSLEVF